MNNTTGLRTFFKNVNGHELVAKCLDYEKAQVMIQALTVRNIKYVKFISSYSYNYKYITIFSQEDQKCRRHVFEINISL